MLNRVAKSTLRVSFLILLIIRVVVSAILHYGLNYYVTSGFWSFCSKVVVGWIGAWIGSPVIGNSPHRIPVLNYADIWIVPAILNANRCAHCGD